MHTLHIYGQEIWHDDAYIAGTREALEMLRTALDMALTEGRWKVQVFACDGEGYTVQIVTMTEDQAAAMPVPYTDEMARPSQEDQMQCAPWKLP